MSIAPTLAVFEFEFAFAFIRIRIVCQMPLARECNSTPLSHGHSPCHVCQIMLPHEIRLSVLQRILFVLLPMLIHAHPCSCSCSCSPGIPIGSTSPTTATTVLCTSPHSARTSPSSNALLWQVVTSWRSTATTCPHCRSCNFHAPSCFP